MKNKSIVVTGGGTGGHLSIAKVLIDNFKKRDIKVIYIGSTYGADLKWFKEYDNIDNKYFLNTVGVVNKGLFGKIKSLLLILKATTQTIFIFKKYNVSKVISVGGYSASPASFAAKLTKKDFYIHEQNSIMGKLNQISSKWAKEVFGSYNNATFKIDYPVDNIYFNKSKIKKDIKTIIFLGGSQGSKAINTFALQVAKQLDKNGIKIIHQVGIANEKYMIDEYAKLGINVDCFGFTNKLLEKLEQSDFAVCRAGASTVWELVALSIPAFYIPYPFAAANHQYYNAKNIVDKKLGFMVEESKLNETILDKLLDFDIEKMSRGIKKLIQPNGINTMVDKILK
jgi:UDP-N-acetylglucosamine--N-acetylmuramyl-(pentapeptide) pyrophosphoryl-undecaprenol N-acetylglucosamine transferase